MSPSMFWAVGSQPAPSSRPVTTLPAIQRILTEGSRVLTALLTARKHSPEAADWRHRTQSADGGGACHVRIVVVTGPRNSVERCPAVVSGGGVGAGGDQEPDADSGGALGGGADRGEVERGAGVAIARR